MNIGQMAKQTVVLKIFDYDRFTKNELIGQIHIPLKDLDMGHLANTIDKWYNVLAPEEEQVGCFRKCVYFILVTRKICLAENGKFFNSCRTNDEHAVLCNQ